MKLKLIHIVMAFIFALAIGCSKDSKELNDNKQIKELAIKAQDALFKDHDATLVKKYFREDYIQHNPYVPTGIEPILGFIPSLKESGAYYKNHRLLADGDFVVLHNTYHNNETADAKGNVAFDVWRMQDGQVAEHWDAVAPIVAESASGRSQYDGPTEIEDLDKTAANKELVTNLMNDVFLGAAPEKITEYISSEQYDQHNPMVKDGLDGLNEAFAYLRAQNNMFEYHKVHRILGEGNFVLVQSEGSWGGKPQAFYDLFRIKDGKVVEHWDVIQEIPAELAHDNGMF